MRTLIIILSVALIFVGIAAVMYVDVKADQEKKKEGYVGTYETAGDIFSLKQSMKQIDSVTASLNYPFTVKNVVVKTGSDSSNVSIVKKI